MSFFTRPAHRSDLVALTTICVDSYIEDEGFQQTWPNRHAYKHQFRAMWSRILKSNFVDSSIVAWVTVYRSPAGAEEIAGLAFWTRKGPPTDTTARAWTQWHASWWEALERRLLSLEDSYVTLTRGDAPGADLQLSADTDGACIACAQRWRSRYIESWHLRILAVSPAHQRKGLGAALVRWGVEHATAEGVPVTLFASPPGQKVYEKLGFVVTEEICRSDGTVFNPFMVMEPSALKPGIPRLAEMDDVQELRKRLSSKALSSSLRM